MTPEIRLGTSAFTATEWVDVLKKVHERKIQILAFANNHYAGYGPGTIEEFRKLWQRATASTKV